MLKQLLIGAAITSSLVSGAALAESAEEKGLRLAKAAEQYDLGWKDSTSSTVMILRNKSGAETRREMSMKALEVHGDGDKSLMVFHEPKDVRNTAMLTHSHITDSDDQWMFLPARKRVRRIASRTKSGPFMSSEFAFEDLGSQEVAKYTYKFLREESLNGRDNYVIERDPVDRYSGYTKQIVWMDKEHYYVSKIEFYDRKKTLLKTLVMTGFKQYASKHWRADVFTMSNHQTGKSTVLEFSDYKFQQGLTDDEFNKRALKRR